MPTEKACKICKKIYEKESECPNCGAKEFTDGFKGKIFVEDPEQSEIAQKLEIKKKGEFAVKV